MAGINGVAVGAAGAGLLFLWSGLKGASVLSTLQSIIQGHQPTGEKTSPIVTPTGDTGSTGSTGDTGGDTSAHGSSAAHNQAIAKVLAAPYGWSTGREWDALVALWNQESSWSNTNENPSSGAYGIPQSLPYSKMPKAAWPPRHGGSADPTAQIQWGLDYIKQRYGDPLTAWGGYKARGGWY